MREWEKRPRRLHPTKKKWIERSGRKGEGLFLFRRRQIPLYAAMCPKATLITRRGVGGGCERALTHSLTHSRGFFLSIGVFILRSLTNERMNERTNSSEIKERKREKTTTTVRQTEREIRNDLEVWSFPRSYKRVMNVIHTTLSCCCSSSSSWEEKIRVWRGECTIVIACSSFRWKNNENFPVLLILSLLSAGAFIL